MHWIQYSIISNIAMRYFNVSSKAINWTALVFEVCYIPLVFPASWVLDRYVSEHDLTYTCSSTIFTHLAPTSQETHRISITETSRLMNTFVAKMPSYLTLERLLQTVAAFMKIVKITMPVSHLRGLGQMLRNFTRDV
jgi:hypothetical protein